MADQYYERVANRIRMEMDERSPRLRLSVIGYLTEAGVNPADVNILELTKEIVGYVSEHAAAYADDVAKIEDPVEKEEDKNAYDVLKDKSGYL